MSLIQTTYKPVSLAGQFYARAYGTATPLRPIGNVLTATLSHTEEVKKQQDMTRLGGGLHSRFSRVTSAMLALKLADINVVNLARSILGTAAEVDAGNVTNEPHKAYLGGLIRLENLLPKTVVIKKGATPVTMAGNYEVRPEGIFILDSAVGLVDDDDITVDYGHAATATVEALTAAAPELEISLGGLNEADSGKPVVIDCYRVSQSVAKQLSLIGSDFMNLDVEGELLVDPTKTGEGISRYYRVKSA